MKNKINVGVMTTMQEPVSDNNFENLTKSEQNYYHKLLKKKENLTQQEYIYLLFFQLLNSDFSRDFSIQVVDVINDNLQNWYLDDHCIQFLKEFYQYLTENFDDDDEKITTEVLLFWEAIMDYEFLWDCVAYAKQTSNEIH